MKRITLAIATVAILIFSSCVKDAGTGTSTINFQLKALVSPVNGAAITWTAGTAGVVNTKIEAKKNDSTIVEFKASPNTQVDLFGTVNISNVAVPAGTFRRVEFSTELQPLSGGKPALHLEGTYTAGGVTTPISFDVNTNITVKSKRDSIVIAAASAYAASTSVGLVTLTQDVTEADLKVADRTSGKIIISSASNTAVYTKMFANLAKTQAVDFH